MRLRPLLSCYRRLAWLLVCVASRIRGNAMIKTLVLVSMGLGLAQFGVADSLNLPFSITVDSTILDPPPNPFDWTEPESVSWQSLVSLDFTSGPDGLVAGYFLPCLGVAGQNGGAGASFGSVAVDASASGRLFFNQSTCSGGPADFSAVNDIPFTFEVTQTFVLYLGATAFGARFGGVASAGLESFEVFDSAGDNISSQVSFTLFTPEPGTLLQLIGGILIFLIYCGATRRWKV